MQFDSGTPWGKPERPRGHRTLRSVSDFLSVPPAEIRGCLRSFEDWLHKCHALRGAAVRDGVDPAGMDFTEFTWHAREEPSAHRPAAPYAATTEIEDLGLRPSAMHKLREQNLYALEDFTQASEDELLATPDVGRSTVVQIRSYLHALGLDFKPSPHPGRRAVERAKIAMRLPAKERRLTDESPISDLGLKPATVSRCLEKQIATVGDLRNMSLRDIWIRFGEKSVQEIMSTLDAVGLELVSKPTQLEKWRHHAISKEQLQLPGDEAPIAELRPWLGAAAEALEKAGVATVGAARSLAGAGGTKVRGMGETAWRRVSEFFGVAPSGRHNQIPPPAR